MRQTALCDHLLNERCSGFLAIDMVARRGGGGAGLKILSDRDHVFMWASNKAQ